MKETVTKLPEPISCDDHFHVSKNITAAELWTHRSPVYCPLLGRKWSAATDLSPDVGSS